MQLFKLLQSARRLPSQLGLPTTPTASLQKEKTPTNECPVYDINQSDGEAPRMQELWGMRRMFWHLTVCKQKLYLYKTELFEIEFGVKWPEKSWCTVKQTTNQPANSKIFSDSYTDTEGKLVRLIHLIIALKHKTDLTWNKKQNLWKKPQITFKQVCVCT